MSAATSAEAGVQVTAGAAGRPVTPLTDAEVEAIRADFPVLSRTVADGAPLVYLDSGATAQRPRPVIEAEQRFLEHSNGAVHRGAHQLAEEATDAYEAAREAVAGFAGVAAEGLVWTRNATEGINILASALSDPAAGALALGPGDEIVVTEMEHHANLVPWQRAAARTGATVRWVPVTDAGRLDLDALDTVITPRTRVVAFMHASNVLGTVNPAALLAERAHAVGALAIMDACQSAPHLPLDLPALGIDAAVFSGHKMLGPYGIGVLAADPDLLAALPPVVTGGSMVETVTMETATFRDPPQRFEAGTPPVSQTVGLHAAVDYLQRVGLDRIAAREHELTERLLAGVASVPGVRIIGPADARDRIGNVSFEVEDVHPHDVGQVLDASGIAVRVGHHCAQPVHRRFGVTASTRASLYLYTSAAEIDTFVEALGGVRRYFGRD